MRRRKSGESFVYNAGGTGCVNGAVKLLPRGLRVFCNKRYYGAPGVEKSHGKFPPRSKKPLCIMLCDLVAPFV